MGRRKSSRKPPPKRKNIEPLDNITCNCPFCNHEKSCDVKIDKDRKTGRITCRICMEDYQTSINILSEPLDVYNNWIDACEATN